MVLFDRIQYCLIGHSLRWNLLYSTNPSYTIFSAYLHKLIEYYNLNLVLVPKLFGQQPISCLTNVVSDISL